MMRLGLLAVLFGSTVLAQTAQVSTNDLSRGTTLMPNSVAFTDEATSLVYNPAGLGRVGQFSAVLLHEHSNTRSMQNTGLWLGASITDMVGVGIGFEWLRPTTGFQGAKSSLGFSVGPRALSIGTTLNWFYSPTVDFFGLNTGLNGLVSADLGLQSMPARWLSFGAMIRNLNTPANVFVGFTREYTVGFGLRPFGERLSLGVDWIINERLSPLLSRLQYTANIEPVRGIHVIGGFSHAFAPGAPSFGQVALALDFEHFGYTQGVSFTANQANFQFMGRFSADKYGTLVPAKKIAVVSLGDIGGSATSTLGSLLGVVAEDRYLKFIRFLDRAADDPDLAAVVLKVEGASVGFARADEVRSAIVRLRANGKKVVAYALSVGDAEYVMTSACDAIYAAPEAMFMVDGLRSSTIFFGGTAELLGITVDVARVGKYKNFPDQFTRRDMSDEQREAVNAYLDTTQKTVLERVTSQRKIDAERWQAFLDEGLKPIRRVKQLGLIDDVLTPPQFDEVVKNLVPGALVEQGYRPFDTRTTRWGTKREIAIVPVLGNISGGKNQNSPLGIGLTAGAQSFIEAITEAANDENVAAIVLRVDSGGGDGLASDLMYRAVIEAKKKKPVVASMGDVAASGGYYVAMGADEIWASPTTLTGSIGVFFAKPAVRNFANGLGVFQESINRGKNAGITDLFDPWTDEQRLAAQSWVDEFYDTFITEVAASRKLDKAAVDAVARGRVWSGEDAKGKGLVDKMGGLMDAISAAKVKAGFAADDRELALNFYTANPGLMSTVLSATAPKVLLELPLPSSQLPLGLDTLLERLGPDAWLLNKPGVQARMEYSLELR